MSSASVSHQLRQGYNSSEIAIEPEFAGSLRQTKPEEMNPAHAGAARNSSAVTATKPLATGLNLLFARALRTNGATKLQRDSDRLNKALGAP
jgi:hypothetical protein